MAVIGSLSVKLGLVTVEWDAATAKAKQQAKDLQKSFDELGSGFKELYGHWKTLGGAVTASALGFGELISSTLEYANQIKDLSQAFDISIGKTLQFRDALQTSGGNAEQASKMLGTLFSKVDEAQRGNEAVISQFERMGLTFADIKNAKPEEQINQITKALAGLGDKNKFEQIKLLKDMFGRGGVGVDMQEVADKVNKATTEYDRHAASIKKLGEVSDNLKTTFDNLKLAFADLIAPFTREGVVSIDKFKAALLAIGSVAAVSGIIKITTAMVELVAVVKSLDVALAFTGGPLGIILAAVGGLTYLAGKSYFEGQTTDATKGSSTASGKVIDQRTGVKQAAPEVDESSRRELVAQSAKLHLLQQQLAAEKELGKFKIQSLDTDKYTIQLKELDVNLYLELSKIESQRIQNLSKADLSQAQRAGINAEANAQKKLADQKANDAAKYIVESKEKEIKMIQQQIVFAKELEGFDVKKIDIESQKYYMTTMEYKLASEEFETRKKIVQLEQEIINAKQKLGTGAVLDAETARIQNEIDAEKRLSEARKASILIDEQRRTSFVEGWDEAYRAYQEDSTNASKLGSEAFNSLTGNMTNALDTFVKTGKLSFKDLARSIIQDLIAIQLRASVSGLFRMLIGSVMGGGISGPSSSASSWDSSIQEFADGGSPPVGVPSLVGERGPELFIPKTAGTIIPNGAFSGMGGTTNVTNNYINAIDTKSFEQRLLGSSTAVWAANQYGAKSLATTTGRT
jgi:lambda family phage tail tape measure protein